MPASTTTDATITEDPADAPITLPDTEPVPPFQQVDQAAAIRFKNMASTLGIDVRMKGWGIGWTDIEGDGTLDLWFTNHAWPASLFRQDDEGVFTNIAPAYTHDNDEKRGFDRYDSHGVRFLGSPQGPKTIWEDSGRADIHMRWSLSDTENSAPLVGLDHPGGRGRYSYWADFDHDGDLDAHLVQDHNSSLGTSGMLATADDDGTFVLTPFGNSALRGLLWIDLDGDDVLDVMPWGHRDFLGLDVPDFVSEVLPGDFDHDGQEELLLFFEFNNFTRDIIQPTPEVIQMAGGGRNTEESLTFFTTGQVTYETNHPELVDLQSHGDGTFTLSHTYGSASRSIGTRIESNEPMIMQAYSHMEHLSGLWDGPRGGLVYLDRVDGVWTEQALPDDVRFAVTGATLDMDNDGDLDVYLGCQRPAMNLRDLWLVNDGTGTFELLHNNGPVYEEGSQGYLATGDYDRDGRVDVAIAANTQPARWPLGRVAVLHNETMNPGNHVRILLDGPMADTVGAKVELTTSTHTQTRWYRAGQDHYSHHEPVMHFGIGGDEDASVTITWPGGGTGTWTLAADEELVVLRPSGMPDDTGATDTAHASSDTAHSGGDSDLGDTAHSGLADSASPDSAATVSEDSGTADSGSADSGTADSAATDSGQSN